MPLLKHDLVQEFGNLVEARSASLFVGAGMSAAAGMPLWSDISESLQKLSGSPPGIKDASLQAEYFVMRRGGHAALDAELLQMLTATTPKSTPALRALARIPVTEFWTTNYDTLIEDHLPHDGTVVISSDPDYAKKRGIRADRRVLKIHGDITQPTPYGSRRWTSTPVMTRGDYERYPQDHPILWSVLKAAYLSRSMLFLGVSFDDPNMHVLMALARTMHTETGGPPHYAIMRVPPEPDDQQAWQWRREDLENTGVRVCEIYDYEELNDICEDLARRSRGHNLFISGSWTDPPRNKTDVEIAKRLGGNLAKIDPRLSIHSLASGPAVAVASGMREVMTHEEYSPSRLVFHFRRHPHKAPPTLPTRMGTCVYWDEHVQDLRPQVLNSCRAIVIIGGGSGTMAEVEIARRQKIPVIPFAATGGTAQNLWQEMAQSSLLELPTDRDRILWDRLPDSGISGVDAVTELVKRAMYIEPTYSNPAPKTHLNNE